jgi:hypothetical protein
MISLVGVCVLWFLPVPLTPVILHALWKKHNQPPSTNSDNYSIEYTVDLAYMKKK